MVNLNLVGIADFCLLQCPEPHTQELTGIAIGRLVEMQGRL